MLKKYKAKVIAALGIIALLFSLQAVASSVNMSPIIDLLLGDEVETPPRIRFIPGDEFGITRASIYMIDNNANFDYKIEVFQVWCLCAEDITVDPPLLQYTIEGNSGSKKIISLFEFGQYGAGLLFRITVTDDTGQTTIEDHNFDVL